LLNNELDHALSRRHILGGLVAASVGGSAPHAMAQTEASAPAAALSPADGALMAHDAPGRHLRLGAGTYRVPESLSLHGHYVFDPGAVLKPDPGVTVEFRGGVTAGYQQIFDCGESLAGQAACVLRRPQVAHPEWWGAAGDGARSDTLAWERCLNSVAGWSRVVGRPGAVYLFGMKPGYEGTPGRRGTLRHGSQAQVLRDAALAVDLNGSTLRMARGTYYCAIAVFSTRNEANIAATRMKDGYDVGGERNVAYTIPYFEISNGTLDGNRSEQLHDETNVDEKAAEPASEASKGHMVVGSNALVIVRYAQCAVCTNIKVTSSVGTGVNFMNCELAIFDRCRGEDGVPFTYGAPFFNHYQAHYFKSDGDHQKVSLFSRVTTTGGSHGITVHVRDLMERSVPEAFEKIKVFIRDVQVENAAESGIHIEHAGHVVMDGFEVVVTDPSLISGNVHQISLSTNLAGFIAVSNGTLRNATLGKSQTSRPDGVYHVSRLKILIDQKLMNSGVILLENAAVRDVIVRKTTDARVEPLNGIVGADSVEECRVENLDLGIVARRVVKGCVATGCRTGIEVAVVPEHGATLHDVAARDCIYGIKLRRTRGAGRRTVLVTDCRVEATRANALAINLTADSTVMVRGCIFTDFGRDSSLPERARAAVGCNGKTRPVAGVLIVEGCLFSRVEQGSGWGASVIVNGTKASYARYASNVELNMDRPSSFAGYGTIDLGSGG
jgi:hypothetical protein